MYFINLKALFGRVCQKGQWHRKLHHSQEMAPHRTELHKGRHTTCITNRAYHRIWIRFNNYLIDHAIIYNTKQADKSYYMHIHK